MPVSSKLSYPARELQTNPFAEDLEVVRSLGFPAETVPLLRSVVSYLFPQHFAEMEGARLADPSKNLPGFPSTHSQQNRPSGLRDA